MVKCSNCEDESVRARDRMAEEFVRAGLRPGGVALVHSSLRSLGLVPGGADTVIEALRTALGSGGTLLMPALSHEFVNYEQRIFDVLRTPSCVGALTEVFRCRSGVLRSLHPTHSVCGIGPAAQRILSEHHLDSTPCGERSPFRRLRDIDGQIVFIGCGTRCNTSMHGVEELVEPPYCLARQLVIR